MRLVLSSEFLLMQLSRLGFCVLYDEVTRFKCSVMHSGHADVLNCATSASAFTQFIADNVDHSVRTLDGLHTFHGMGIIAASVMNDASSAVLVGNGHIPRLQTLLKVSDVCRNRSISVVSYDLKSGSDLKNIMLSNIWSLQFPILLPSVTNLSLLWHNVRTTAGT